MYKAKNDRNTFRTMAMGFTLICIFSGIMHQFLIRKEGFKTTHYEPTYDRQKADPETLLMEGGGTVSGKVVAVSADKFFLQLGDRMQPFKAGEVELPKAGDEIAVTFAGGRPPTALLIVAEDQNPEAKP